MSDHIVLTLNKAAAKTGGDKYLVTGFAVAGRERFIYVPQSISRQASKGNRQGDTGPLLKLQGYLSASDASAEGTTVAFKLISLAKGSGDDRYTPQSDEVWTGDIYMPKTYRSYGDTIYLTIMV
jgi:hypothetical protein